MKVRLATRLLVWVGVPAALLFAAVLWISVQRSTERVITETERSARATASYYAARLDGRLNSASRMATLHKWALEAGSFQTRAALESYLRTVVAADSSIYGSCIAFRPHGFDPAENAYAPYFFRSPKGAEFVQLGDPAYNYFQWDWYRQPRDAGQPLWTEPYFDDGGGGVLMTTYSVPFKKDGAFWGIATIDISMSQLLAETQRITVGKNGYAMIISRSGRLLAFPDETKILKLTLQEAAPELAQRMISGQEGFLRTREPLRGEEAWVAFVPIQSGGFSLALVYPKKEVLAEAFTLRKEQLTLGAIGVGTLFFALFFLARSISRPITQLAEAAQQVAQGNLEQRLHFDSPLEEVQRLTHAFNKMTRDLQMRMQELRYTTTIKERYEGELSAARSIQMSLVPKQFPPFPERTELAIHALVKPAREIGGDFYDFHLMEDDWLSFFIGDVSGKGVPAALFMAVTKTLLKASSSKPGAAAEMLAKVNNELCDQTDSCMFVSLLYGSLDLRSGMLELGNAGHPSPFRLGSDGSVASMEINRDIALGALRHAEYRITQVQLTPGDALFFYTDGVTEALNNDGTFYQAPRLQIALQHLAAEPVEKITRGVLQDVRAFTADREQSDDISLLAVRWLGPSSTVNSH